MDAAVQKIKAYSALQHEHAFRIIRQEKTLRMYPVPGPEPGEMPRLEHAQALVFLIFLPTIRPIVATRSPV